MNKIKILKESVASLIAAGEVIERPAGVLKELIENSLDAGATTINIDIEDAGKKMIRVHDNGRGMSEGDLKLVLARHSTSKIVDFEDLDSLNTFGFRGEALYSVAAVAEVVILSSLGGGAGAKIASHPSKETLMSPAPAIKGTTVEVKNLFFNTPARLKFLKSDSHERACLLKVIEEGAFANLSTTFNVKVDGKQVYSLEGSEESFEIAVKKRAERILGKVVADSLVFIESEAYNFKAFLTPPDKLVSSRDMQFAFINKRPLASKTLQQAVYKAYQGARANNKHPAFLIYMTLPPQDFDVNIHPQKKDVRFVEENKIFSFLMNIISKRIFNNATVVQSEIKPNSITNSTIDFLSTPLETLQNKYEKENAGPQAILEQPREIFSAPFVSPSFLVRDFEEREAYKVNRESKEEIAPYKTPSKTIWWRGPYRFLASLHKTYLLFENDYGLIVLDQHAARERVMYEKYLEEFEAEVKVQPLMIPITIDLPASQVEVLLSWASWLKTAGFEIEQFSTRSIIVNTVPHILRIKEKEIKGFIVSLSSVLGDPIKSTDTLKKRTVALLACKKSIKAKESLSAKEAEEIISDLKNCKDGLHCPHGRPVLIEISIDEIAKKLGR